LKNALSELVEWLKRLPSKLEAPNSSPSAEKKQERKMHYPLKIDNGLCHSPV
jgi:hypothetical protein